MGVGMGHQLARPLGRGIERQRLVNPILQGKGKLLAAAIDRGGAGVDQVGQTRQAPTGFQHHKLAHDVGIHVGIGVDERVAHPGLGGQMDHPVRFRLRVEELEKALAFRKIQLVEGKAVSARQSI